MDKPLDVSQLSTCCGKPLVWTVREMIGTFDGACYECGRLGVLSERQATRQLLPTEKLQLARIAELEAAQRWRVTTEELPPVGEWVVGHYGGSEPCEVVQYDGDQWNFRALLDVNEPDFWLPIPAVPSKPGAS